MVLWTKVRSTHVKAWELSIMSTDVPFHDLSHKKGEDRSVHIFILRFQCCNYYCKTSC